MTELNEAEFRDEFDRPWKHSLEWFFMDFLALCFPKVHALIDPGVPPEFLDKELASLIDQGEHGDRILDLLVRVKLLDGTDRLMHVHVEVQAQYDGTLTTRVRLYNNRVWDKYGGDVISLIVLADDNPNWLPDVYTSELGGFSVTIRFPIFKVIALADPEGIFANTGNPFALVVAAHQEALATKKNWPARKEGRKRLLRKLSAGGMSREARRKLIFTIGVLTRMPREWELKLQKETSTLDNTMTNIDDLVLPWHEAAVEEAEARGVARGEAKMLLKQITRRFGPVPSAIELRIKELEIEQLESLALDFLIMNDMGEVETGLKLYSNRADA